MNSITTEEVERLMRVVSEPLRKQWEVKNYGGRSLVELQNEWNKSVSFIDMFLKRGRALWRWGLIPAFIVMCGGAPWFGQWVHSGKAPLPLVVLIILLFVGTVIAVAGLIYRSFNNLTAAEKVLESCAKVFLRFQESVHALNPHGIGNTYHDVITADYAYDRLKSLAIRVIDAQVSFDAACKSKSIDRWNITHLGNFIQKAEETFDKTLRVGVEDFSLPFEKRKTYEEAQAEYDKRRPVVATH